MAKISRISCRLSRKFNLGNYESAEVQYGEEIEPMDSVADVARNELCERVYRGFAKVLKETNLGDKS